MQIATLSYQQKFTDNSKLTIQSRHIVSVPVNSTKKQKQQRSNLPKTSQPLKQLLPTVKTTRRPSSIRITGSGLASNKFSEQSRLSFHPISRSQSRQSDKSDIPRVRSRSVTPAAEDRIRRKLISLRFGYPVKIRSSDFYSSSFNEDELRLRENSFVNDAVRSSHQSSIIPRYNPLDDPNLSTYFQSPLVLDVIRKTLDTEIDRKLSHPKKRSKKNERYNDYRQIVAKKSSGYSKLNGYDCIPLNAPARQRRSKTNDRYLSSISSSLTSFPNDNSGQTNRKIKRPNNRLKPLATSSPFIHTNATKITTAPLPNLS